MSSNGEDTGDLVLVYEANVVEADMVCSLLEGSGVHAVVFKSGIGAYPMTVGPLGGGRVMVGRGDEERAREILAAADMGELEIEEVDEPAATNWLVVGLTAAIALGLAILIFMTNSPKY